MNRQSALSQPLRPLAVLLATISTFVLSSCEYVRGFRSGNLGIFGAVILILDIIAILDVFRQPWGLGKKLLWIVIIAILPILGLILYYLIAGRGKS